MCVAARGRPDMGLVARDPIYTSRGSRAASIPSAHRIPGERSDDLHHRMLIGNRAKLSLLGALVCALAHADPSLLTAAGRSISDSQQPAAQRQVGNSSQVIIEAPRQRRLERRAHAFVNRLTHSALFYGDSIAMWRVPLCFLVAGLPKDGGELVLARLSGDAASAGVRLAKRRCHPNFIVIFTSMPDAELNRLKSRYPRMLGDGPSAEMQRFLRPGKARVVRIWHNAYVSDRYGVPMYEFGDGGCYQGGDFHIPGMLKACPTHLDIIESRLSRDRLVAFSSAIIVVDTTLARRANLEQVADYIALLGLADINPDVNVGDSPTILKLFTAPAEVAPRGLTIWDRAFLDGLYHSHQSSRGQRSEIELTVARAVSR
jgi:hypothetical protein